MEFRSTPLQNPKVDIQKEEECIGDITEEGDTGS